MIKGITPRLSETGKIKIGGLGKPMLKKSAKGKQNPTVDDYYRMPLKFDHFIVTKTSRSEAGDLEHDEALMAALPKDRDGKCREIPVVLHSDDIDEVFPTAYALYAGRKLACTGNGEKALRYDFDKATRQRLDSKKEVGCVCPYYTEAGQCKPHGTLHASIFLPNVALAGAVYKWRTTSEISISRMLGSLQQILAVTGTLRGLPLVLKLEPVVVSPEGKSTTVYTCHLELRAKDLVEVQTKALEAARIRNELGGRSPVPYRALISAPGSESESPGEQAEVYDEFHSNPEETEPEAAPATTTEAVKNIATQQAKRQAEPTTAAPAASAGAAGENHGAARGSETAAQTQPKGDGKSKEQREAEFREKNRKKSEAKPAPATAAPVPAGEPDYGAPDGAPAAASGGGDQEF